MHDVLRGDRLPGQGEDHHGDDDQPAADAQEAGQDAGDGAYSHIHQNNCQHVKFLEVKRTEN